MGKATRSVRLRYTNWGAKERQQIHTGRAGSVFGGRTPAATSASKNALSATDLPQVMGATIFTMAMTGRRGEARTKERCARVP